MTGRLVSAEEARKWLDTPIIPEEVKPGEGPLIDFIDGLAFTVEQQGKQIAAALALHRQGWHDFITGVDCNREECGHEDGCPTERLAICSGCDRQHSEVDDYYLERTGGYEAVKWPCPTARALGVES